MNNTKSPKQILNDAKTELKSYWSAKSDEELRGADFKVDDQLTSRNVAGAHIAAAARYVVASTDRHLDFVDQIKAMEKISNAVIQVLEAEIAK